MLELGAFCDGFEIDSLIPADYENYRRPIYDALMQFLAGLPAHRIATVMKQYGALRGLPPTYAKYIALATACPTMQKLAQLMARDRRLSSELRSMLQAMESVIPTTPHLEIRDYLVRELGPLADLNIELAEKPIAEGSVAVVIPFRWSDPHRQSQREGVFKVLKVGAERHLEEELALLEDVGMLLDQRCREYGIPSIDYAGTFSRVRQLLSREVRLDQEQANLAAARSAYASNPTVLIPELFPFCTDRITAMARIRGHKVTDFCDSTAAVRRRWAQMIVEALIADPIWSGGRLFHADPHAGNLLRTSDETRLGIVDWSLVGRLSKNEQLAISRVLLGAMTLNVNEVARAISSLSINHVRFKSLRPVIEDGFRCLRHGDYPGLKWINGLMDDAVKRTNAMFTPDLLMFRKVLYTLECVVADVDIGCDIDRVLIASFLRRLTAESADRMLASPFSRSFHTHVSNADMLQLYMSIPLTGLRYFCGRLEDWLAQREL